MILVATATPTSINAGSALGGLIAAMVCIGLGTGGLKACIAPMCGEQNSDHGEQIRPLESGETVIVDGKLTTARIFMW